MDEKGTSRQGPSQPAKVKEEKHNREQRVPPFFASFFQAEERLFFFLFDLGGSSLLGAAKLYMHMMNNT